MQIDTGTLSNGLRLLHVRSKGDVSVCGAMINAGSRDETDEECGYAHFIEHMLFKRTGKRNYKQIINRIEDVGGDINAFTTKEDTTVYATVLKRHLPRAFELICDMVFNSVFDDSDIAKEREVIADEIESYNDNPMELILDDFEDELFSGLPIGHNILGNYESLSIADNGKLKSFYSRCYTTDQILLFSMGDHTFERVMKLAENLLSSVPPSKRCFERQAPTVYHAGCRTLNKDTKQVHCVFGNRAYSSKDERRNTFILLNNILGAGGMGNRLNMSLREKNALVYAVESQYTQYSDTGNWNVYMGVDYDDLDRAEKLAKQELSKLCEKRLSEQELAKAKRKQLAQMAIAGDVKENWLLGTVRRFMECSRIESRKEIEDGINSISADDLMTAAQDIFDERKLTFVYYR